MNFEQRCSIPVGRDQLWDFLIDVPKVGDCVPGVSNVAAVGDDRYQGVMTVRVGPISMNFNVDVTVEEMDRKTWHAAMRAEANDRRIGGGVKAHFQMRLEATSPGATDLIIRTDVNLLGRLGQFGQPLIRKKADSILEEFAANVRQRVSEEAGV